MTLKKSAVIDADLNEISQELRELYDRISGKTFLIAGGAGFLGRYFVLALNYLNENKLLSEPCKIIVLDNLITGLSYWINENENLQFIKHDITHPLKIEKNVDYIIHAASIASPLFYDKFKLETINAGFLGTQNLLEIAREKKVKSFLFMSSSEIYGMPELKMIPTPEHYLGNVSCTGPRACYDESKRIGETLCVNYADIYNIPVKIVRPFNVFGPGLRLDDGRAMPTFVREALIGGRINLYGGGRRMRTFCYVTNAIVGFYKVLLGGKNKEAYNVGMDYPEIEMRHLADIIHGLVEVPNLEINIVEDGPLSIYQESDPDRRCPDLTKIRRELDYHPKVNLISGLKRFISWAKDEAGRQNNLEKSKEDVNA